VNELLWVGDDEPIGALGGWGGGVIVRRNGWHVSTERIAHTILIGRGLISFRGLRHDWVSAAVLVSRSQNEVGHCREVCEEMSLSPFDPGAADKIGLGATWS